jgi:cytochrome o ubiquinol oxidase subunit II
MQKAKKSVLFMLLFSGAVLLIFLVMQPIEVITFLDYIDILAPKGKIGLEERNLLLIIQVIMLLVVIPVYLFTFLFSYKYSYKEKATYDPDLVDNKIAEVFWWGIPTLLTTIIAVLTYIKTAELDPFKPIASEHPTKTIQVVALQWKWLFIYPEEQIASVNFLQFPAHIPIRFEITADAPMNSFWIPRLGGQIYAMPGMKTQLHLIADEQGEFKGSSANLSGEGFAGMHFITRASTEKEFQDWISQAQQSAPLEYQELVKPSIHHPVQLFRISDSELFNQIIMKYMHHG